MPSNIIDSPFGKSIAPGEGEVVVAVLPPAAPTFSTLSYQYPLKIITRTPQCDLDSKYPASASTPVHLYLLSYGGGLLPGDHIEVSIKLKPRVRMIITTPQGSTKVYKTVKHNTKGEGGRMNSDKSWQKVNVELSRGAGLCYLPDPSTPFQDSRYEQAQIFTIMQGEDDDSAGQSGGGEGEEEEEGGATASRPSLCMVDWVTEGRSARGEHWSFGSWTGRNEVWVKDCRTGKKRLLLRDTVILDDESGKPTQDSENNSSQQQQDQEQQEEQQRQQGQRRANLATAPHSIASRAAPHGILGTLILYGPLFDSLAEFFMQEFSSQPRIGDRNWSLAQHSDSNHDATWTAARIRSKFVLVKFGAPNFETAKSWLGEMFRREGSIEKEFGEEALAYL